MTRFAKKGKIMPLTSIAESDLTIMNQKEEVIHHGLITRWTRDLHAVTSWKDMSSNDGSLGTSTSVHQTPVYI